MSPSSNSPSQTSASSSQPTPPSENSVELIEDASVSPEQLEEGSASNSIPTAVEPPEPAVSESSEIESSAPLDPEPTEQPSEPETPTSQHPIPPPSEPRQYRAIGLVRGRYHASEEQFTQGTLYTSEGAEIDAVLLGRVMSLVKKHIDLNQEHLWVVYPRTRQEEENLHVQIVGIWEPETLKSTEASTVATDGEDDNGQLEEQSPLTSDPLVISRLSEPALAEIEHGYFSVRGEVVYQSQDDEKYVIIKIRQSSRKPDEKPKFFKLKLNGLAGLRAVGHFWDLHVRLNENDLEIEESHDIGELPTSRRKPPFRRQNKFSHRGPRDGFRGGGGRRDRGSGSPRHNSARPVKSSIPKPTIQKNRSEPT